MGGRGTFASGINVAYTYETVGYIEGVKILQPVKASNHHGLPESAHSSNAYIKLDENGNFKEMRLYDKNHCLYLEIGYHAERKLTGNRQTKILHYHTYDEGFSKTKIGSGGRSKAKPLTDEMKEKYRKYFKGVKL